MFLAFDTDGSGGIDEKEFMKALGHKLSALLVVLVISCSPSELFDAGFIASICQIFPPVRPSELFEPALHLGTVPPGLSPNVQTPIRNDVWRLRVPATQRTPGVFSSPALP